MPGLAQGVTIELMDRVIFGIFRKDQNVTHAPH
jgi:hypothetical protein